VVTLALAFAMEAVWFRNSDIIPSEGARVTPPSLLGADLGIGSGAAFPRLEFGLVCLVTLVMVSLDVAVLPAQLARLGDAGGAGQRAFGRRCGGERRPDEGAQLRAGLVDRRASEA
jgi:hypothetical protein